jgi:hypothetical protein
MKVKGNKKSFDLVGVRFSNDPGNIFTYKARRGAVFKGQELVVDNHRGTCVCIAVQINATNPGELAQRGITELKWLRRKVVML